MAQPFLRRALVPFAILFLICTLLRNSAHHSPVNHPSRASNSEMVSIQATNLLINDTHDAPLKLPVLRGQETEFDGNADVEIDSQGIIVSTQVPPALLQLIRCPTTPNRFTNHIRLSSLLQNISMSPMMGTIAEKRDFWNPTIIALPSWSENQYLVVSMVLLKDQGYRQSVLCEANICFPRSKNSTREHKNHCSDNDLKLLGPNGGLRCVTEPANINLPPTPAKKCEGSQQGLADIPGFHDPRLLYLGRGEPILMVASQSQYACIGLWIIDLRALHPPLTRQLASSPKHLGPGPLMSYSTLTELTRNPPSTRLSYEKNWVIFSPSPSSTYLQYELTPSQRTISKLVGGGLTTTNLTDSLELPCLQEMSPSNAPAKLLPNETWHQATPSLKLVLCARVDASCQAEEYQTVFFAAIHRKHVNAWGLPLRYERYFVIWSTTPPFSMLAVSQHPILFANEITAGWSQAEIWDEQPEVKSNDWVVGSGFSYTTTIAYAWGREDSEAKNQGTGYLDDEMILSVGVDDQGQTYATVLVSELLQCLRICPRRT